MKKTVLTGLGALMLGFSAGAAALDDACLSFSTRGPDRYADGQIVADGECYALVWSPDGVFDGFDAGGALLDAADRLVLVAPVAKAGRCPPVLFQIPAATAAELAAGRYAVYLLDTRVSGESTAGRPRGLTDGQLKVVNGYGAAVAEVRVRAQAPGSSAGSPGEVPGTVAGAVAAVPTACPQPRVKSFRVEGDRVFLTVENLKGFMRVQGGGNVKAAETTSAAVETSGTAEDVILVAPKTGAAGFYKVIRNR